MKRSKKMLALALSLTLMLPVSMGNMSMTANAAEVTATDAVTENELTTYGGWNEALFAEWEDTDAKNASVSYKLATDSDYTALPEDDKELIRQTDTNTARVDVVGLTAGTYDLKITTSEGIEYTVNDIVVNANDRSGYAHYNYTRGVGAYEDDGTLKEGAIVLYVTNENKDTIQVPGYESYGTGIGYILNCNAKLMEQIVSDGKALDIRFVGTIDAPEGLTAYNSTKNGGAVGDNGNMAIIKMSKDVTLEGIGTDAMIEGWGFSFYVASGYENHESYEVRNLIFENYPEDALGFQGYMSDSKTLSDPIEHVWVHNNTFYPGYCANPAESDKAEGDGSCDFKRGQYYTMDYNYYYGCHKTNLIGASDSNLQFNMTLHHNYYENCGSRSPLARQANIHIYNSYFKGNTAKTVDARANAYIFSEANYYEDCKNPMLTQSGAVVKSYNDVVYNCQDDNTATVAATRSEEVTNNNKYSDFDINSSIFYYDDATQETSVSYITDAAQAKADCIAYSGVMKTFDRMVTSAEKTSVIENVPENTVTLPYSVSFTDTSSENYFGTKLSEAGIKQLAASEATTIENIVYSVASKYSTTSTSMKLRTQGMTFSVDTDSTITITEEAGNGKYALVLYDEDGKTLLSVEDQTDSVTVEPGVYMIQSANAQKDAYIESLVITAVDERDESKEDSTEESTETPVEGSTEESTETTPEGSTEAPEGSTEESTETTPEDSTEDTTQTSATVVKMGSYDLNKSTLTGKKADYGNMTFDVRDVNSSSIKMRSANTITFTVDTDCTLALAMSGAGVTFTTTDGSITYDGITGTTVSAAVSTNVSVSLKAGTYVISGAEAKNNTVLTNMTFTAK